MADLDRTAQRPPTRADGGRVRPTGWSPGTGTLLGAWIASAAIARLTGATAVILLLAATLVAVVFEIVAGWWATRSLQVTAIVAPSVVTVGEPCRVRVSIADPITARLTERGRIRLLSSGNALHVDDGAVAIIGTHDAVVAARFDTPGLVRMLTVRVDITGPAGLIWWRRTTDVAVETLHVAPIATGPMVEVDSVMSSSDGATQARRGNHGGEIDGVRPWRPGDATNSVHWASSLRSDELIVHDRVTAADERWIVDLDTAGAAAGRLRWSLDEARRQGHPVAVRTTDAALHPVTDEDAAARWAAIAAQAYADDVGDVDESTRRRGGVLHREVRLRAPATETETETAIAGTARWTAAAAAVAGMAMLVGALDGSTALLVLIVASVALGAVVSLWLARRSGTRPLLLQVAIVAAVLMALGAIAVQAADVDGLLAALRGPLPNMLMLLVVLHGFETVDRRTLRVHLAIGFVLASYAAGLRIDATLGWWLAAWGVPFVASLLTTSRRPHPTDDRPAWSRRPVKSSAPTTARWVVTIVALGFATLAVLSLVPIPDGPARLGLPALSADAPSVSSPGGLARPDGSTAGRGNADDDAPDRGSIGGGVGYPGFTETLDTSVRGDLGEEIVMRVRAPQPAFWRGQTFTEFDGRTWTVSPDLGEPQDGPVIDVQPTVGDALGSLVPSDELIQTYFVEQDLPNVVFAAPRPVQVFFDGSLWTRPDGALRSDVTLTAGSVYTVISERVQVDADILRSQGDLGEVFAGFREVAGGDEIDPFLELPASTTQRTIDLATTLRTETTYDTILAYEAWLGANTEYDLDAPVPADGADAVDDFLFESRLGFCEQIASTLTIMLRSQGVPARLATGYVSGERDRVSGVWNVRGSDAHAWVEVWFPLTGWQAFDPTADVPLAADAGNGTVGGDLIGATLSSIVSYRFELALAVLGGGLVWGAVRLVALVRHRRRRGRWGLLQDRFSTLSSPTDQPWPDRSNVPTNAHLASTVVDSDARAVARVVADELDRVAFDPSWVDDDDCFERARSAMATLERSRP